MDSAVVVLWGFLGGCFVEFGGDGLGEGGVGRWGGR